MQTQTAAQIGMALPHPAPLPSNDNRFDPIGRIGLQVKDRLKPGAEFCWAWFATAANRITASVGDVVAIDGHGPCVVTEAWLEAGKPVYRTDASPSAYDHTDAALLACDPMGPAAVGDLVTYWDGQAWQDGTLLRCGGHGLTVSGPGGRPRLTNMAKAKKRASATSLAFGHRS